jgi:hypothetical protein
MNEELYKWLVIQFELSNTPPTFIQLINQVIGLFINKSMVIYFDNILIYNKFQNWSHKIFKKMLEVVLKNKLYMNFKIYSFMTNKQLSLSFIINIDDIYVNGENVRVIGDCSASKIVSKVCSFYGLTTFYKWFI